MELHQFYDAFDRGRAACHIFLQMLGVKEVASEEPDEVLPRVCAVSMRFCSPDMLNTYAPIRFCERSQKLSLVRSRIMRVSLSEATISMEDRSSSFSVTTLVNAVDIETSFCEV